MFIALAALTTFVSTTLGGIFGLRFREHLYTILGFTAGILLGVVAFDLLPEIFGVAQANHFDPTAAMIALVAGFLGFHVIEKLTILHFAHEDDYADHKHPAVGTAAALALSAHSFLDGVGIGLAFQVNTQVGLGVALAVIVHDFYDGLNTINLMLLNKNSVRRALYFLALDAIAPVLGALSTLFFKLNDFKLMI
jgi:ZIP family zinc transporter